MVVKLYITGISGNKEVKKRQQRVLLILDSKNVKYETYDIAEPNMEEAKDYMHNNSKLNGGTISDPTPRHPLPPQIFNDDEYCGDYDAFDMANETDEMEKFLKLAPSSAEEIQINVVGNGDKDKSKEATPEIEEDTRSQNQENGDFFKEKSPSPVKISAAKDENIEDDSKDQVEEDEAEKSSNELKENDVEES